MALLPETLKLTPEQMFERLQKWWQQQQQLRAIRDREVLERKDVAAYYFPSPREGTSRLDLGGGFDLKLDFGYTRNVDEAALDNAKVADFKRLNIDKGALFDYKPVLKLKAYRTLTEEQRAFVDELLESKQDTPQLHIVPQAGKDDVQDVAATTPPKARAPRKAAAKKAPVAPKPPAKKAATKKVAPKPPRAGKR